MAALREIPGLESSVEKFGKWIDIVSIHQGNNNIREMTRPPNFMIERGDLARGMLQHLRQELKPCQSSSLLFHFGCAVTDVFLQNQTIATEKGYEVFDRLVAADGAHSQIRQSLAADPRANFSYRVSPVPGGYRGLYLQVQSDDELVKLDPRRIHGWMAPTHQMIAVPIKDEYCSGVCAFTDEQDPFADMDTPSKLFEFLRPKTPELTKLVSSEEATAFLERPTLTTETVKCNRLTIGDRVVLIGDAGHAFSSAFNQGCTAALQDGQLLNRLLVANNDDWTKALEAYDSERLEDVHAGDEIANYSLPRTKLMRIEFFARLILRNLLPGFLSERMRPLPMDITKDENMSYTEMLEQCRWWTDRVKQSMAT
jgi:kynurenine 3-monooxygenase